MNEIGAFTAIVVSVVSLGSTLLLGGRVFFRNEAKVEELSKACDNHSGKLQALDVIANEGKSAHYVLAAKHEALAATVALKASAESVVAIRESHEQFRREMNAGFERIHNEIAALRSDRRNDP